jgi:hypothetical protein
MFNKNILTISALIFSQFLFAQDGIYEWIAREQDDKATLRQRVWASIRIGYYLIENDGNIPQGVIDTGVNLNPAAHFNLALPVANHHGDLEAVRAAQAGLDRINQDDNPYEMPGSTANLVELTAAQSQQDDNPYAMPESTGNLVELTAAQPQQQNSELQTRLLTRYNAQHVIGIKTNLWFLIHLLRAFVGRGTLEIQSRLLRLINTISSRNHQVLSSNRDLANAVGRTGQERRLNNIDRIVRQNPGLAQEGFLLPDIERIIERIESATYQRRRDRDEDNQHGRDYRPRHHGRSFDGEGSENQTQTARRDVQNLERMGIGSSSL